MLLDSQVVSCELLLDHLKDLDVERASEAELTRAMEDADQARDPCRGAWRGAARDRYERTLADHRTHQLALRALVIESVLAERFDNGVHICDIQREAFQFLLADIAALEQAIPASDLSEDQRRQLIQLRDLDLESIDVLMVAHQSFCR